MSGAVLFLSCSNRMFESFWFNRLIYEVFDTKVEILALIHGARDFAKWRQSLSDEAG